MASRATWGIGGAIVGALANEHLSAVPRIRQAFQQGRLARDGELQPVIARLQQDNAALRAEVARLRIAAEGDRVKIVQLVAGVAAAIRSRLLPTAVEGELRKALPPGTG
ncbi:MAG TPA: hypothetical protein VFG07_09020 [Thermoplasmata archaeon]|nr:hypothetical protein [Thermoplasmata archaeon]